MTGRTANMPGTALPSRQPAAGQAGSNAGMRGRLAAAVAEAAASDCRDCRTQQPVPVRPGFWAWASATTGFLAGVVASTAANVAHAESSFAARAIAGWAPLALLLTVEVLLRVPPSRAWWLRWARRLATAVVAAVAALASYRHMTDLAAAYGEDLLTARTLPLSADGLMVVSSLALIALAEQHRRARAAAAAAPAAGPPIAARPTSAAATTEPGSIAPARPAEPEDPVASAPAAPTAAATEPPPGNPDADQSPQIAPATDAPSHPEPHHAEPNGGNGPAPVPDPAASAPDGTDATASGSTHAAAAVGAGAAAAADSAAPPADADPEPATSPSGVPPHGPQVLHAYAHQLVKQSLAEGRTVTGAQVAKACGRSERWGRQRLREVKQHTA